MGVKDLTSIQKKLGISHKSAQKTQKFLCILCFFCGQLLEEVVADISNDLPDLDRLFFNELCTFARLGAKVF